MDAEMEKLKKRKEELTRMAKESAKPVFRRDTVPLRPNLYRQPSNLSMPFQRGASADYDLYRPSQEIINARFPPPPADSNNYGHFIPPNLTYPPTFDPFQAPPGNGLGYQVPSHVAMASQASQQLPLAAVDYAEESQYWDVIDGQYDAPDWSQSHYP